MFHLDREVDGKLTGTLVPQLSGVLAKPALLGYHSSEAKSPQGVSWEGKALSF